MTTPHPGSPADAATPSAAPRNAYFIRVPKTASTSIMSVLKPLPNVFTEDKMAALAAVDHIDYVRHGLGPVQRRVLGEAFWSGCFRFAFVRNPWDRYVSNWRFLRPRWSFAKFVDRMDAVAQSTKPGYDEARWHVLGQRRHLVDDEGELLVDLVGRFETLQADFDRICTAIGLAPVPLPRLRQGRRDHYSHYYTPRLRKVIAARCEEDIDSFGYAFEPAP